MNKKFRLVIIANTYNFFNVFKANELILKSFEKKLNIKSITDTRYSITVDSIYSRI